MLGFGSSGIRFASSLIITRLLAPEIFGLVALASAVVMIISLLSDIGLKQFVIYSPRGADPTVLNTVWTLAIALGAVTATATVGAAAAVYGMSSLALLADESVYAHPDLPLVLAASAGSALILGLKSPVLLVLEKNLDLKPAAYIELVAQLIGTTATLLLAWQLKSVWSIIIGGYIGAMTTVVLSHFAVRQVRPRLQWSPSIAKEVVRYGRWIAISSAAAVLAVNADRLLLSSFMSATQFAFYALAVNIVQLVEQVVNKPFAAVGMPALSEVAKTNPSDLRRTYFKLRLPYDVSTLFLAGVLFAVAQFAVDLLYDPRYGSAGEILQALSCVLLFTRYGIVPTAHAALGFPQTTSWVSIARLLAILVMVPVGHHLAGFQGVVWAVALHALPSALLSLYVNRRFALNSLAFEIKVLLAWPAGFLVGVILETMGTAALAWLRLRY